MSIFKNDIDKAGLCFRVALFSLLLVAYTGQVQAISKEALQQGIPSLAPMLEQVTPAVVSIRVTKTIPTSTRFFFNGEGIPEEIRRKLKELPDISRQIPQAPFATGAGSGVIVDAQRGLIISNHHVISGAANIEVQLTDGRRLQAEILGSDESTDIALLKIEADQLVDIQFADVETVQVGDYVVAIGNPFSIGQTVTSGIVSALGRGGLNRNNYEDFIQTDAAINLGNSGGALVDMEGRLIGINTAIISGSGGSNGIGFAVPIDMVATVMDYLEQDGEVRRGVLGVTITDVTPDIAAALSVHVDEGALVTSVLPSSSAEAAGIRVSDVIVEIDDQKIAGSRDLRNTIGLMRLEQQVALGLYRDGERMNLNATIGGLEGQSGGTMQLRNTEFRGAHLGDIDENGSGVAVLDVDQQSRAWAAGLRPGDQITHLNRQEIDGLEDFNSSLENLDRFAALSIRREEREMLLLVP